jgi:hypothetical protein
MSDSHSAGEGSTVFERTVITVDTGRISGIEEAVLGTAFVGERIFLYDGRDGDGRDDKGIY